MTVTQKEVKTFDPPATPVTIIKFIAEYQTAEHHRVNLSAMLIAWLKIEDNRDANDEIIEDMYFSFYTISEALKMVHSLKGKELPCTN